MNLKPCHSVTFAAVLLALIMPVAAFAQEEKSGFESENAGKAAFQQDHENPNGADPEVRANKNQGSGQQEPVVARDSEIKTQKTSAPKAIEKPQKDEEKAEKVQKKEEDPLSFNFLYYIIEKFKFSDIVD